METLIVVFYCFKRIKTMTLNNTSRIIAKIPAPTLFHRSETLPPPIPNLYSFIKAGLEWLGVITKEYCRLNSVLFGKKFM